MMKTFFGIAVGLILLFSNTMVQAVPPHTVPVITVAVTIQNSNTTQSLNLQYQPSTLGGIPTPSTSSLTTSVGANSSALVNIPMLPGNYYLIAASYDSNNFCKFNFFVRQDGLYRANKVYRQGNEVYCKISVSGKNSVAINMTMAPPLAVEGVYCKQGSGNTIALFSDGTAAQNYSNDCSTFVEMKKISQGSSMYSIKGNYTLAPNHKISIRFYDVGVGAYAPYQGTYSVSNNKIQTISLGNAGASSGVYERQ